MARRSDLSMRLTRERERLTLSLDEAAARVGVAPKTLRRWELGTTVPGKAILFALAEVYDIDRDALTWMHRRAEANLARRRRRMTAAEDDALEGQAA